MPAGVSAHAHSATPILAVSDARGLSVRAVGYHRREANDPIDTRVTQQRYDAVGRLIASRDPYLFDLAQTDEGAPFNLNQVLSLSATALLTESVDAGWRASLLGDSDQDLQSWDGRGSSKRAEYDELMRPVALCEAGIGIAEHVIERFTYGDARPEAAAHNLCGQLVRHDDPAGAVLVQEAGLSGLLLKHTRRFLTGTEAPDWPLTIADRDALLESGAGLTTFNVYTASGEALSQTDAMGNTQSSGYTRAGQLKDARLTLAGAGQSEKLLVSNLHYNAMGQIEAETAGNGVVTRHRYDEANGRLIELSAHKPDGAQLQQPQYQYDAVGNVLSIEDVAQPIRYFNNQRIEPIKTYRYDTLDQLIEATGSEAVNGSGGPALPDLQPLPLDPSQIANYTQTFHYDSGGNLLDLVHVGAQAQGRTLTRAKYSNRCLPERDGRPPTEAELVAGFDANGNLQELQPGQRLVWDLRNQLREVKPVVREDADDDRECYVYDGSGQRVRKVRSSVTNARTMLSEVRYLPGLEIRSHGGTGEILHVINASAGSNSVQVLHWVANPPDEIAQNQLRYSLNDQIKSNTLELDQNADVISWEWYYAFGGTAFWLGRSSIEVGYKTVRYSGKERDASGLLYYGLRYYPSWLQRWINPDPWGYTDGLNLYAMVGNNAVTYFELNGTNGEKFNPEQYLSDIKTIIKKNFPIAPELTWNTKRANHYANKIIKIKSIASTKNTKYFQRQISKLKADLKEDSELGNYHDETSEDTRPDHRLLLHNLERAYIFESLIMTNTEEERERDLEFLFGAGGQFQQAFHKEMLESAGHVSKFDTDFNYENFAGRHRSRTPLATPHSHTGFTHTNGRRLSNDSNFATDNFGLPIGTSEKIVDGLKLAHQIIKNEANEKNIFENGFDPAKFREFSLKIHPDKLNLEGFPHVRETAATAFKIISYWKDRADS
ncbi:RHS repeat-associated core domain-containing protein [Pseudomonas sp. MYb118]|uniref:RHS repeat-associated core domain-containing protein n=1 Tax=Pseudomonas sp. MYb118 TaxID=1848720 RepID=UPI0034D01AB0